MIHFSVCFIGKALQLHPAPPGMTKEEMDKQSDTVATEKSINAPMKDSIFRHADRRLSNDKKRKEKAVLHPFEDLNH